MTTPTHDTRLRTTVGLGHIAGICQSLGFDYKRVAGINITPDAVTVEEFDPDTWALVTTELKIERRY